MRKQSNSMSVLAFFMAFIAIGLFFAGMTRTVHADPPCNVCQDHDWITQEVATSKNKLDALNERVGFIDNRVDVIHARVELCLPKPCGTAPPKTGQNEPFGDRDDGELQKGAPWPIPRFTDNEDGTVTDNLTGLIWLKDANCSVDARTWTDALDDCNTLADGSCGLTDGSIAGAWRLPNVRELLSLVDYGRTPAVHPSHPFDNVVVGDWDYYWSSTATASVPSVKWAVKFDDGSLMAHSGERYVWCVRDRE